MVYESIDKIELSQIKALLDNNQIDYYVKNESTQNLFSTTSLTSGYDVIAGSFQLYVNITNFEIAKELIQRFNSGLDLENQVEQNLPDEVEFNDTENNLELNSATQEDQYNLIRLLFLSLSSYFIILALFSIKFLIILKDKFKITKTVLILIQIPLIITGIKSIFKSSGFSYGYIFINILILFILLAFKGVKSINNKKMIKGIFLILPIFTLCTVVLLFTFSYS